MAPPPSHAIRPYMPCIISYVINDFEPMGAQTGSVRIVPYLMENTNDLAFSSLNRDHDVALRLLSLTLYKKPQIEHDLT